MKILRFLAILLIPQWLFLQWIDDHSSWIDLFYVDGIYRYLSPITLALTSRVPFSIGDVLYISFIIYLVSKLWQLSKIFRWKALVRLAGITSLILFMFHIQWGFHYHRTPLSKIWDIKNNYSIEELYNLTTDLIESSNEIHNTLTVDSTAAVVIPYKREELLLIATNSIRRFYDYPHQNVKVSLLSTPLSYMGYSGYLNPFTLEAQVNSKQPKLRILTTATHEIAHQLGYAAEEEANFVGIKVAMNSDDVYMRYAGHTLGLQYCLRSLRKSDSKKYDEALTKINTGIVENYKEIQLFWRAYQNPFEPVFKKTYDQYLKANNQTAGIASYNLVVGLLLHEHIKVQSTTSGAPAASNFFAN